MSAIRFLSHHRRLVLLAAAAIAIAAVLLLSISPDTALAEFDFAAFD